ncbi:MAG: helix-turn-helix domain-containing protein, partial [Cellulomonas sp.]|nr:helix-turn-helix domain-containing protein [Cellulomonas sp.]
MPDELADDLSAIGALAEPARRALYRYVVSEPHAVSREQAATALGMPLHSAKFHLDRLVEEGLLEVQFRRLSGRSGPGAGRPSKLYRRSDREVSVSLPERHYDLAGDVLATAIDRALGDGTPIDQAVRETAAAQGRRLAAASTAQGATDEGT